MGVNVEAGVLVRVGMLVAPPGVLVREGVAVAVAVWAGPTGVFVRVGVRVAVGTGGPPGALPQTRELFKYAGICGQSV